MTQRKFNSAIIKETMGRRIRTRREQLGLTQDQLAALLGYKSRSTINKIEMGINDITQSKIEAFARALETTPSALMGWESFQPRQKRIRTRDDASEPQATLNAELSELSPDELCAVLDFVRTLKANKK